MATRSSNPTLVLLVWVVTLVLVGWDTLDAVLLDLRLTARPIADAMIAVHGGGIEPIGRLGPVSYMPYGTSTSGLSTWWSTTALRET
jgi:hypothetical protein